MGHLCKPGQGVVPRDGHQNSRAKVRLSGDALLVGNCAQTFMKITFLVYLTRSHSSVSTTQFTCPRSNFFHLAFLLILHVQLIKDTFHRNLTH